MPSDFTLNRATDVSQAKRRFQETGIVQIPAVFTDSCAERLYQCLQAEVPWGLAYEQDGQPQSILSQQLGKANAEQQQRISAHIQDTAAKGYQYCYYNYPILDAYLQSWPNEVPLLHDFLEFINAPEWLSLIRQITGNDALVKSDAQATLYGHHCFLHRHSDYKAEEGWRIAYVLSMTKNWRPDFGGTLQFLDDQNNVEIGLLPQFNALNLFAVPRWHMVTYVPPFAPIGRYAITGWLRDQ